MNNNPERLICSAIWYSDWPIVDSHGPINIDRGIVLYGPRHHHIISLYKLLTGKSTGGNYIQGFITTHRRFVDRLEGAKIAEANGIKLNHPPQLFSEDLY